MEVNADSFSRIIKSLGGQESDKKNDALKYEAIKRNKYMFYMNHGSGCENQEEEAATQKLIKEEPF